MGGIDEEIFQNWVERLQFGNFKGSIVISGCDYRNFYYKDGTTMIYKYQYYSPVDYEVLYSTLEEWIPWVTRKYNSTAEREFNTEKKRREDELLREIDRHKESLERQEKIRLANERIRNKRLSL